MRLSAIAVLAVSSVCFADVNTIQETSRISVPAKVLHNDGDRLFLAGDGSLRVYNMGGTGSLTLLKTLSALPGEPGGLVVDGHLLVASSRAETGNNLKVIDIANLASPQTKYEGRLGDAYDVLEDVCTAGAGVFLAASGQTLTSFSFSPEYDLTARDTLAFSMAAVAIRVDGARAYVATWGAIHVVDISDPDSLESVFTREWSGLNRGMTIEGTTMGVAGNNNYGLSIVDLATPDEPVRIGRANVTGFNHLAAVDIDADFVYAAALNDGYGGPNGGLRIFDIRNPRQPTEILANQDVSNAYDVFANGGVIYVAEGSSLATFEHNRDDRLDLKYGWNLMSINRVPTNNSVSGIFGGHAVDEAWVWAGDHYDPAEEIHPLRGHWVFCSAVNGETVDLAGLAYPADEDSDGDGFTDAQEATNETDPNDYSLALTPGWNLVSIAGLPANNTVLAVLGSHVFGPVWTWDGVHYVAADAMLSMRGYWAFSLSDEPVSVTIQVQQR